MTRRFANPLRLVLLLLGLLTFGVLAPQAWAATATPEQTPASPGAAIGATAPSGVYYEIFVRSFYDTNGDGIGDLDGITTKLDYLHWLGVSDIWLMPIFASPSYHGYDVTNYRAINPEYGDMAAFERLVKAAHARGIKVIIDLVANHTSIDSAWFKAAHDPSSPYHDWYIWAGPQTDLQAVSPWGAPVWRKLGNQHYLGIFDPHMPDLNYRNPAVRKAMIDIGRFWLQHGADGFRLDAAKHIYDKFKAQDQNMAVMRKSAAWWSEFREGIDSVDPHAYLVGEVSGEHTRYLAPFVKPLNAVFDFPMAQRLVDAARSGRDDGIGHDLVHIQRLYLAASGRYVMDAPFLTNHDQDRIMSDLDGNEEKMKLAAAMLLTLPGNPFVYYGEEIGMRGTKPDPQIREPMRWEASLDARGETTWEPLNIEANKDVSVQTEMDNPHSLLTRYRELIHWRMDIAPLRDGVAGTYDTGSPSLAAWRLRDSEGSVLVVHNLSDAPQQLALREKDGLVFTRLLRSTREGTGVDKGVLSLPPYSSAVLEGVAATAATSAAVTKAPSLLTVRHRYGFDLRYGTDVLTIRWLSPDMLDVHLLPDSHAQPDTQVLAPDRSFTRFAPEITENDGTLVQRTAQMQVQWNPATMTLAINNGAGQPLLRVANLGALLTGQLDLVANPADALYGLGGYSVNDDASAGLLREGNWRVTAGMQGHPGAPWLWSTSGWGVLVDTLGADVSIHGGDISWSDMSKPDTHFFVLAGTPDALFAGLRKLSGAAPLFPKWSLGFINSQWGIDQKELLAIVHKYRALDIPLDAFSLDFDWKAWGQNDYGEFRWNTAKFPGGPDGQLKKSLDAEGVHLIGIMKPRIHVHTIEGQYASEHDFWFPGLRAEPDYFSHKLVQDLAFDNPAQRAWYFNPALRHSFETGIVGWWNDEADTTPDDTQFMNMERALYDGQRKYFPDTRVFSLNRDFYLGAQRYAYALWSGDIKTGFASMAAQRARMLSAIGTGEMWWGMDGGGFVGRPDPENYARWIEFDAFCPIFRVHGEHNQHRQPWVYGPTAQAAAVAAMRLRYRLMPYIYSYAWQDHLQGVGIVRTLAMAFPGDAAVRNDINGWMFGHWLLVAPVMQQGQTEKTIQLPPGTWTEWATGKVYAGGQAVKLSVDATTWADIPLFVRTGAIIPMQPAMEYVDQHPVKQVTVEVFPARTASSFAYYDDDGDTYAYEHGHYYLQQLGAQRTAQGATLTVAAPQGSYMPALKTYLFAVHGFAARAVQERSTMLPHRRDLAALKDGAAPGWTTGQDRFGSVTYIKLPAATTGDLSLEAP